MRYTIMQLIEFSINGHKPVKMQSVALQMSFINGGRCDKP